MHMIDAFGNYVLRPFRLKLCGVEDESTYKVDLGKPIHGIMGAASGLESLNETKE